jgi:P-type Cu+ transporter
MAERGSELVELAIGGMSCGSCAARIERRLNRLDGVAASVNYATERAYITSLGGRDASELIGVIKTTGYTAVLAGAGPGGSAGARGSRILRRRVRVCVPLAVAIVVMSAVPAAQFRGWQWVSLLLTAPVASWGAWPLYRVAWRGLGHGTATMDTLVSLGVIASLGWSLYALAFGGAGHVGMRMQFSLTAGAADGDTIYLEVAAGVTAAVLTGRYLESRAKRRAGAALSALAALGAKTVLVLRDGTEHRVGIGELRCGEQFVVRPGERIGTDGVVVAGRSAVDASMLTGESMPAEVGPGDEVTGACVNLSGKIVVRVTRVGADTMLAQLARLVGTALASKASAQRLADRIAGVFVPCVIAMAIAALGFWLGAGLPAAAAWSTAVAVLVVACPCALGLATPAALMAAIGRGAELGILVSSAQALETAGRVRVVVLDKTGTLTTGTMTLHDICTADGTAGGGRGGVGARARAVLSVGDALRPGAADAVAHLGELGLSPILMTGDSRLAAEMMAGQLGIPPDRVMADVRPDGKVQAIRDRQDDGVAVAMVGDGVNDAAALAQADLGMAIGTGTDAAIGAADLTLISGDPRSIADAIQLARATMAVSRANLCWAFGYNVVAIPLALLRDLNPLFAGVAMSASSLLVVFNSLRLRRFRPDRR